ncbi:membrane protein [Cellulomonas algicola]|uniref:Membrane protein n=1 Tax=Cellulomonas algicola TaxID=2071633 RepID=A0A401UVP6_9CELL|nr:DoxX family protein [Cellulomonas algicola]GCD18757.1 membrane protein [Cellulomonas algicola]
MLPDPVRRHGPALALAAVLGTAGVLHLRRPAIFTSLVPRRLGDPEPWVLGSGVAELACAAVLVPPATRRLGGLASAALLVGVFPGNVTMAVRSHRGARHWSRHPVVAWGRLPLQVPLVAWALAVSRRADRATGR